MRNVVLVALVAWIATTSWAQSNKEAKPETLLRWSFVGTKHLAANKDLQVFNQVRAMPETLALRDAAARNFAVRAATRFGDGGRTNSGGKANSHAEIVALIQPLIPDLLQNESRFQLDTLGAQDADWILAVKLADKRSQEWSKSLAQLAKLTAMQGASANNSKWTATRDKYKLTFSRAKDWTVIQGGFGAANSQTSKDFLAALSKRGQLTFDAAVNAPLLAKLWSAPHLAHFPKLTLQAEPKRDGFQSELLLDYPQDLGIKPEKWNVPTNIIRDPLIGFTAIQGIQKKLAASERFRALGAKETPNQVFMWAQSLSPFSITLAADVKNPAETVTNAARAFKDIKLPSGDLMLPPSDRPAVVWRGLPVITPFLEVAFTPDPSFLTAGFFRVGGLMPEPAPAELFSALNLKNLIYYDWEITGERLEQWYSLWQLFYLLQNELGPDNNAPSAKLLKELRSKIGNTITTGTLENPRRLKFVRQSHLGPTALELVLLAHLVDANDLVSMQPDDSDRKRGAPPAVLP